MTQAYCAVQSVPEPFLLASPTSADTTVSVVAPITLVWADGSTDHYAAKTRATSAYDGGAAIDTTATVWLLVAVHGVSSPQAVREQDYGSMDATLGGTPVWAVLRRLDGDRCYAVPQI